MATINASALIDENDVKEVIDTDASNDQIRVAINAAYYRSKDLVLTTYGGDGLRKVIQQYLAAHFLASTLEPQVQSQSIGGEASVTYRGKTDMGLNSTTYGQQAIALDASGGLAKAGLKKATFSVWSHADIDYDSDNYDD